jgi:5-methyltetrahydrofolate--homocysteine methyltransferase
MNTMIKDIYEAIMNGQQKEVSTAIQAAIAAGLDPVKILNQGMIDAMTEVGRLYECGEYYIPEMLIAARAMQTGLDILRPHLAQAEHKPTGKVVIGTVKGDLHDIGKNLVGMMLEGAGFDVIDLGNNVSPDKFMASIIDHQPDILAMSALLTTTMLDMKTTIDVIKANGLRNRVKIIIGGAPITEDYAVQIGADGYSPDASRATSLARSLMGI